jgi:hypothetical protein
MTDNDDVLIYDLETEVVGFKPDGEKDILRVFGFYSYKNDKFGILPYYKKEAIKKVLDSHKFLVGFNNKNYDDAILKRSGYDVKYKISIDLLELVKKRAGVITIGKGSVKDNLMRYRLDDITRFLNIVDDETAKEEIDYDIFKKTSWNKAEIAEIKKYTIRDIEITKKLYEWLEEYFEGFKEFVNKEDIKKKKYLTDTIANFAYKAICKDMDWEPVYNRDAEDIPEDEKISGGYVAFPAGERFEGNLVQLDFSSLYPHVLIQGNLLGRNKNTNEGWHGGGKWEVQGFYNDKELSGVSKLIRKWYFLRLHYKRKGILENNDEFKYKNAEKHIGEKYYFIHEKNGTTVLELREITKSVADELLSYHNQGVDPRQYTIKIIINTCYGILNTPYYKLIHDEVAGGDCTRIGRQWTKYARKVFREEGYNLLYSDSVSKDSKIRLRDGKQITVNEYWNKYTFNKITNGKEYAMCNKEILTCDENFKNVLKVPDYIIRHKTKKKMFKIWLTNEKHVSVTEDHSLITINPETQKYDVIKPNEINDKKYVLLNSHNVRDIYRTSIYSENKSTYINKNKRILSTNLITEIESDFKLCNVKKVEEYYTDDYVYDFSIKGIEKFYANDVLVHNTDSWYFEDVYDDMDKVMDTKDKVIKDIKDTMPFPQPTFNADVDSEMKYMFFFKGDEKDFDTKEFDEDDWKNYKKGFMKKNYIYVDKYTSEITLKNLGVKKKSISALSKKIFWDYMVPEIKKGVVKFSKTWVDNLMIKLLQENIEYAFFRKDVKPLTHYKKSMTGIHAKFSKRYGPGIHFVIPNNKGVGVGDKTTYCSYEEFKEKRMGISDIDMTPFWKELKYFIKEPKTVSIFDYEGVKRR